MWCLRLHVGGWTWAVPAQHIPSPILGTPHLHSSTTTFSPSVYISHSFTLFVRPPLPFHSMFITKSCLEASAGSGGTRPTNVLCSKPPRSLMLFRFCLYLTYSVTRGLVMHWHVGRGASWGSSSEVGQRAQCKPHQRKNYDEHLPVRQKLVLKQHSSVTVEIEVAYAYYTYFITKNKIWVKFVVPA